MAYHTMPFAVWPEHAVDRSSALTESWRRHSEARPLGQGGEFPQLASIQLSMNTGDKYPLTYRDSEKFSFFTELFASFYKKFTIPSIGSQRKLYFYKLFLFYLQIVSKLSGLSHHL